MMKIVKVVACAAVVAGVVYFIASDDQKEEIRNVIDQAGQIGVSDKDTPKVVREQRRKERARQNSTWTAENRALHPIEFCQAQLEELDRYAAQLEVSAHEIACKKAEVVRVMGDKEAMAANLAKFLKEAKATYRACDQTNAWPAKVGGFSLSKEKLREKIVDAAQRMPALQTRVATMKNQLAGIEKRASVVSAEQKRLVKIREGIQTTIGDLRLKKVIDGDNGITASLNAINDQMGSLGVDYDDPKLEDLILPDQESVRAAEFDKIMAEP